MAKRSDFAQKLLDDLRLRKERIASTTSHSNNSNQSHHLPIDAYAYTKQTYRGSTNTRANEIVSSRCGEMVNRSSRGQKSLKNGGELSNQIIPYGKASFQSNGGKPRRADLSFTNSILGFLHQIQRGTMDRGSNLDRQLAPTSRTLSHVQINEISKGAQKLNHILRACCSTGINMDTYSLHFAKELLQGAIDLEESLGMLVDLQKNSEFMITSQAQNKNRITLLEEEEEEEEDNVEDQRWRMERMQLARPTFSFDNQMQRAITISNSKEARKIKVSQQKRLSTNTVGTADISNQTADKGRIPNVIAKLMGLDNLPEKKDPGNSNIASSKHSAKGSSSTTLKSKQTDKLIKDQKLAVGSFKNLMFGGADKNLILQNQKASYYSKSEVVGVKPTLKDFDKASIINGSPRHVEVMTGMKQDRQNNSVTVKGRSTKRNDPVQNLNNMHERRPQVKPAIQVAKEGHTTTNKHMQMSNEKKSQDHLVVQKSILSKGGASEMTPNYSSKQSTDNVQKKKHQSSINQPTPFKKSSDDHVLVASNEKVKEITNRKKSSPRYQELERANGRQTLKDHKFAASKKIKPEKMEQMLSRRNGQEASDRASCKFNVLNGAERKRFSKSIEHELLPPTTLHNSGNGRDFQEPTNDLQYQDVKPAALNLPDRAVPEAPHEGFKTSGVAYHKSKTNGVLEDKMGVKLQDQNISIQQPLTESENRLKWILVMSQLFVNTAEALFRLNIPFGILRGGRQDSQDQSSKLILDCGYEVMKRKGIRQELKVHTCSNISSITSTVNLVRSLDDLVRKLNDDMEKLKLYGRKESSQVDGEDYLPKMLEHDVHDKCPDIDCMWDFGWNDETFAFIEKYDVIRDTEKHILSVLVDEITKDYCMLK
ncbi:uncharacterized protein LOC131603922 [Vicia villosa]|uniref:uncharacterized protein LOC131603922 n=1 Tax=Vicia villosa TaxID=3911 RepID=UPI00273B676E|nr:uncharacterized protein LOC131603922 [Vicia villosa]